jgi:hypothetical protein
MDELPQDEDAIRAIRAVGESNDRTVVRHYFPFCCLPGWRMGSSFFHWTRWGVFQYVVVRVGCSIAACALQAVGAYDEGEFTLASPYAWISLAINFSQIWAMYCLILFYKELRANFPPRSRPVGKLALVKAVVFVSWWQSVIVAGLSYWGFIQATLDYSKDEIVRGLEDLLICVEMLLAAVTHHYLFSYNDILDGDDSDETTTQRAPSHRAVVDMIPLDVVANAINYLGPRRQDSINAPLMLNTSE